MYSGQTCHASYHWDSLTKGNVIIDWKSWWCTFFFVCLFSFFLSFFLICFFSNTNSLQDLNEMKSFIWDLIWLTGLITNYFRLIFRLVFLFVYKLFGIGHSLIHFLFSCVCFCRIPMGETIPEESGCMEDDVSSSCDSDESDLET